MSSNEVANITKMLYECLEEDEEEPVSPHEQE